MTPPSRTARSAAGWCRGTSGWWRSTAGSCPSATRSARAFTATTSSPSTGRARKARQAPRLASPEPSMEYGNHAPDYWGNLTWEELRAAAGRRPVVIQPIGAMEQHGYHLPLNTDNYIISKICDAAGQRAPDELLILPCMPYAFNAHHMDFPGVIHAAWDHVIQYLIDIITSVTAHGFDRI